MINKYFYSPLSLNKGAPSLCPSSLPLAATTSNDVTAHVGRAGVNLWISDNQKPLLGKLLHLMPELARGDRRGRGEIIVIFQQGYRADDYLSS